MKKILLLLTLTVIALGAVAFPAYASYLGTGAQVIANDVTLIKTGLVGESLNFSDTDFKSALATAEFKKIIITQIPSSADGILTVNGRRAYIGQQIKRRSLSTLSFEAAGEDVSCAEFKFKVDSADSAEYTCEIKFIDKVNYAPKLNTDADETLTVTTQKNISVYGKINASDPEGDALSVIVVSYPKYGTLEVFSDSFGEFKYTPEDGFDGKDSFVFVVRDEYGNYTKAEKVTVKVTERMSEVVYVDMEDSRSYNAAVAMTAMGIMSGSRIGDGIYFAPGETVSRAEFVAMAMKALGIRADSTLTKTYFDDNHKIPQPLVSYIATAARIGAVSGAFETDGIYFRPNDAITKCEAAIVMSNLLDIKADSAVFSEIEGISEIPVWARPSVGAMYSTGVFDHADTLEMSAAVTREYAAEYLYRIAAM